MLGLLCSALVALTLCAIKGASAQATNQTMSGITCYTRAQSDAINAKHCERALSQIAYGSNSSLDGNSNGLFVWHKTCVVNVRKNFTFQTPRQEVEYLVRSLLQACPSKGGIAKPSHDLAVYVYQTKGDNTYDVDRPVCLKRHCHVSPVDCLNALNQLPVDAKGHFSSKSLQNSHTVNATSGNCTVSLSTTDGSLLKATHPEINASFKSLISQCHNQTGYNFFNGGTESLNGDIKILTRNAIQSGLCR